MPCPLATVTYDALRFVSISRLTSLEMTAVWRITTAVTGSTTADHESKPDVGKMGINTANNKISMIESQKSGIDCPATVAMFRELSAMPLALLAMSTPNGIAMHAVARMPR